MTPSPSPTAATAALPAPERSAQSVPVHYSGAVEPLAAVEDWLSRLVSALNRAGFGDRVPDCAVVDEDAILTALDDMVSAARSRS